MIQATREPRFDIPGFLEPTDIPKAKLFEAGVAVGVLLGTHQLGAWILISIAIASTTVGGLVGADYVLRRLTKKG